jgi:hypothetical protein
MSRHKAETGRIALLEEISPNKLRRPVWSQERWLAILYDNVYSRRTSHCRLASITSSLDPALRLQLTRHCYFYQYSRIVIAANLVAEEASTVESNRVTLPVQVGVLSWLSAFVV